MPTLPPPPRIPRNELSIRYVRSSGPGGQNVNKVNSKAVVRWNVAQSSLPPGIRRRFAALFEPRLTEDGSIVVMSGRFRSAEQNLDECIRRLEAMVAKAATPPKKRRKTRVPTAERERRLQSKKKQQEKKKGRARPIDD